MLIKQQHDYYPATSLPLQTVSQVWNMHSRRTGSSDRSWNQLPRVDHTVARSTVSLGEVVSPGEGFEWELISRQAPYVFLRSKLTFPHPPHLGLSSCSTMPAIGDTLGLAYLCLVVGGWATLKGLTVLQKATHGGIWPCGLQQGYFQS